VVPQQVEERVSFSHGDALPAGVVVLLGGGGRSGPLVMPADVDCSRPVDCALHPALVAIVDEGGGRCAADAGQAVVGVVGQVEDVATDVPPGHVAVTVVAVFVVPAGLDDCVGFGKCAVRAGEYLRGRRGYFRLLKICPENR
jgi:hypothetical protein